MRASRTSIKERRQLRLSGFRGVDLSSSPLEVDPSRASYMRNFINEGGVNHKRPGWRELVRFGEKKVNGIFEFVSSTEKRTICQAGNRFYELTATATIDITETCTYEPAKLDLSAIDPEQRSQGFMLGGALYIIGCGDFLVYEYCEDSLQYELRRVADNKRAYVPTTTIGIVGEYYDQAREETVPPTGGATLDDVNLLSSKRKNKFIGYVTHPEEDKEYVVVAVRYTLDGIVKEGSIVEITAENGDATVGGLINPDGSLADVEYNPSGLKGSVSDGESLVSITQNDGSFSIKNSTSDPYALYEYDNGVRGKKVGMILEDRTGFYLYSLYAAYIEGESNITVTFTPDDETDIKTRQNMIAKCTFGTRFGLDNKSDRLFLSGNPSYKNIDFHSEADDYTYFGELNTAALGDESTATAGYAKLSDASLVIYKEESNSEPCFFFRSSRYIDEYDANSNVVSMRGVFPHTEGGVGEGVVSRYAHANLCGDVIFLARSGVYGLTLSENMLTTERYARERSKNIRGGLDSHQSLSDAVGIVYKNKYYLAIDGLCYVADARYKFNPVDAIDGEYNYEWWVWDNIPARVWGRIGDDLLFGTEDGAVCIFDGEFTDRTYDKTEAGELTVDSVTGDVVFNTESSVLGNLRTDDRLTFNTEGIYALVDEGMQLFGGRIYTSDEAVSAMHSGMSVYANNVDGTGLTTYTEYTIDDIDRSSGSYKLYLEGEPVTVSAEGFKLYRSISGKKLYLADNGKDGRFFLKEYSEGKAIRLSNYEEAAVGIVATVEYARPVVAEWVTPVLDLGTNIYSKSLIGMTISVRPDKKGSLSFGYETRRATEIMKVRGVKTFSLDELSFNDFSFNTGFQNSYSVRCNERNFNYIVFRFVADGEGDCVINDFTINYKINNINKGVR